MWIEGKPEKTESIDWNAKFLSELKGELSDGVARETLGKFLISNIGYTTRLLTGFILTPYQRIIIKGWLKKNFSLTVAGRGFSKSFLFGHFCYLYCLFNPGKHIVMVSATFRSSRKILEHIDSWSKRKRVGLNLGGTMLRQCFDGDMVKKQDMYKIRFKNGSTITALPLGDPDRLRGIRANVLGIDEGLLIPQTTIDNVLKPFLFAPSEEEGTKKMMIREEENRLIASGKMTEKQRTKFRSTAKMIILSSASYTWEYLHELYQKYLKIIHDQDEAEILDESPASYLVHQISYKAANPDLIEASVKEEIESGMFSRTTIQREYEAQFVQDSDGYFSAKKMEECTFLEPNDPTIEIVGESGAEYVLGIDQNTSDSEASDHFAMCLMKISDKKMSDGSVKKIGIVVHQYAEAGGVPLREHIEYLYYLLTSFNIVYIGYDATQGKNLGFVNICNESELFKENRLELKHIPAEFGRDNYEEVIKQVNKQYNRMAGVKVQPQAFHADFQRAANEYLQTCFDRHQIFFAGSALANPMVMSALREKDIGSIIRTHSSFTDIKGVAGEKDEFIGHQDILMKLVKKECALIELKANALGHISFDLPSHMKRGKKTKNRVRKDSYSALLLANWCLYVYTNAMALHKEEAPVTFQPFII